MKERTESAANPELYQRYSDEYQHVLDHIEELQMQLNSINGPEKSKVVSEINAESARLENIGKLMEEAYTGTVSASEDRANNWINNYDLTEESLERASRILAKPREATIPELDWANRIFKKADNYTRPEEKKRGEEPVTSKAPEVLTEEDDIEPAPELDDSSKYADYFEKNNSGNSGREIPPLYTLDSEAQIHPPANLNGAPTYDNTIFNDANMNGAPTKDNTIFKDRNLVSIYRELFSLRSKLRTVSGEDYDSLQKKVADLSNEMERLLSQESEDVQNYYRELSSLDTEIEKLRATIAKVSSEYHKAFLKIREIMSRQSKIAYSQMDDLEFQNEVDKLMNENSNSNNFASEIREEMRKLNDLLAELLKRRRAFEIAQSINLTPEEFKEVNSKVGGVELLQSIIVRAGYDQILSTPLQLRTREQLDQLFNKHDEFMEEFKKLSRALEDISILDSINPVHKDTIPNQAVQVNAPMSIVLSPISIGNITIIVNGMPERVVGRDENARVKTPGKAPEDMRDTMESSEIPVPPTAVPTEPIHNEQENGLSPAGDLPVEPTLDNQRDGLRPARDLPVEPTLDNQRDGLRPAGDLPVEPAHDNQGNGLRPAGDLPVEPTLDNQGNGLRPAGDLPVEPTLDNQGTGENDINATINSRASVANYDVPVEQLSFEELRRQLDALESRVREFDSAISLISSRFGNDSEVVQLLNTTRRSLLDRMSSLAKQLVEAVNRENLSRDGAILHNSQASQIAPPSIAQPEEYEYVVVTGGTMPQDRTTRDYNQQLDWALRDAGIDLSERDNYVVELGLSGDDEGISETLSNRYTLYRRVRPKQKVHTPTGPVPPIGPNAPTTESVPQTGPNDEPTTESVPPTGPNDEPTTESVPPTGPNDEPTTESVPPTGPNDEPTTESVPPTGPNDEPTTESVPQTGPNDEPTTESVPQTGPNPPAEERIVIYEDLDDNRQKYVSDDILQRFFITNDNPIVNINGEDCRAIDDDLFDQLEATADQIDNVKYRFVFREVHLGKDEDLDRESIEIPVYIDRDSSRIFMTEEDLAKLGQTSDAEITEFMYNGETIRAKEISGDQYGDIQDIAHQSVNPNYHLVIRDIELEKDKNKEVITIFRDVENNNQLYLSNGNFQKFGIDFDQNENSIYIDGVPCHKLSPEKEEELKRKASASQDPLYTVEYKDIHLEKKKPKKHYQTIINELTKDLFIKKKDGKRYQASNIKVWKSFWNELHSGNVLYNIVHFVPGVIKAGFNFLRKLSSKLLLSKRGRTGMEELEDRFDRLSNEDKDVLLNEYKGHNLLQDMNTQINPVLLPKIKEYALQKIAAMNADIESSFHKLLALLGQIDALDRQLQAGPNEQAQATRNQLMRSAAELCMHINQVRAAADDLLSSGIHGLEEDFKAVSTKLNYVGKRFAKTHDFDNELQGKLAEYGQGMLDAEFNENYEGIVDNFMKYESLYSENTEIKGSIFGRRSVGSKYYTPLATALDYRNDPFLSDLFTSIAVVATTVGTIKALDYNRQVEAANKANQATVAQVKTEAGKIEGHRDAFAEGNEAVAQVTNNAHAGTLERGALDGAAVQYGSWGKGYGTPQYTALDEAAHSAYNQMNSSINSELTQIAADKAAGIITDAQAFQKLTQLSDNAYANLSTVCQNGLQTIRTYQAAHPGIDVSAFENTMTYIANHPNAITNMNGAMLDSLNIANGLTHIQAVNVLGSDWGKILGAISAATIAHNVCGRMSDGMRHGKYGNSITEAMDDYRENGATRHTTPRTTPDNSTPDDPDEDEFEEEDTDEVEPVEFHR